jgi:glycosyltransferase involved in cell wall biosynthesis
MEVLVIYQFCGFGGVERVLLNRAKAFKKHGQDVHISVCYQYDHGALRSFQEHIRQNSLSGQLSAFLIDKTTFSELDKYHLVLNIDTPQLLEETRAAKNLFVECHTPYVQNRQYLKELPGNVQGILVPSLAFKNILMGEFENLPSIIVLHNPVSEEFFSIPVDKNTIYPMQPLAYLARLDELKNYAEALDIFEKFSKDEKVMFAIVGKTISLTPHRLLTLLRRKNIVGKTFVRNEIEFSAVPDFIRLVKSHRGVFVSPSLGESFGLSVAEFMSAGVPVLLSDISVHRDLVNADERFLYQSGDTSSAKDKITDILVDWESASAQIAAHAGKFSAETFLSSWREFMSNYNINSGGH